MTRALWRAPRPGVCRVCGCTDDNACDGGCFWVATRPFYTLCSACAGTEGDLAYCMRWIESLFRGGKANKFFISTVARDANRRRRQHAAGGLAPSFQNACRLGLPLRSRRAPR